MTALTALVALAGLAFGAAASNAESVPRSKKLVVLIAAVGGSMSPDGSTTGTPLGQTFQTLTQFASSVDSTGLRNFDFSKVAPALADSWTRGAGGVYTFKLHRGLKSCAGNELTADDVVWTISRAKVGPGPNKNPATQFQTAGVLPSPVPAGQTALDGEAKAIDRYTVQIVAKVRDIGNLPATLTQYGTAIYDSKDVKAHATAADPWGVAYTAAHAAGFGPYCLGDWNVSQQYFTLFANKGYVIAPPFMQVVLVRGVPLSSNRLAALLSKGADIVDGLSPDEFKKVEQSKGVKHLLSFGSTLNLAMTLNYGVAPWGGDAAKARAIRHAVALALPRADIVANAMSGRGRPFQGLIPSTIPNSRAYPGQYPLKPNIEKAKQLLSDAGYPGGAGLPSDGLQLFYPAESASTLEPVAIAIKAALAQIGMTISLNPIPSTQFNSRQFAKNDLPMSLQTGGVGVYNPFVYVKTWYVGKKAGGLIGVGNFNNPDVNTLWAKGDGAADDATQKQVAGQIQDILAFEVPVVQIARLPLDAAVQSNIQGLPISGPGLLYAFVTRK